MRPERSALELFLGFLDAVVLQELAAAVEVEEEVFALEGGLRDAVGFGLDLTVVGRGHRAHGEGRRA